MLTLLRQLYRLCMYVMYFFFCFPFFFTIFSFFSHFGVYFSVLHHSLNLIIITHSGPLHHIMIELLRVYFRKFCCIDVSLCKDFQKTKSQRKILRHYMNYIYNYKTLTMTNCIQKFCNHWQQFFLIQILPLCFSRSKEKMKSLKAENQCKEFKLCIKEAITQIL